MALKSRAMTLIEVIVVSGLSLLVLGLASSLFLVARRASDVTTSNYFLSKDTETALRWLRRDLQQTALPSIRPYPQVLGTTSEPPGVSLASALEADNPDRPRLNSRGYPIWGNMVFYTLDRSGSGSTGKLIRWVSRGTAAIPQATSVVFPSSLGATADRRVLLTNVVVPNAMLAPESTDTDLFGGFRVSFVRKPYAAPTANQSAGRDTTTELGTHSVSLVNPQLVTGAEIGGNTRLVEVELKLTTPSSRGKLNYYSLDFRVCPRY